MRVEDPAPGPGGFEGAGLRPPPHRLVPAVAPAEDADALAVDGRGGHRRVDALQDVAEVSVSEVLHVALREGLTLAVAAARIGHEDVVALGRQDARPARGPARRRGRGG